MLDFFRRLFRGSPGSSDMDDTLEPLSQEEASSGEVTQKVIVQSLQVWFEKKKGEGA